MLYCAWETWAAALCWLRHLGEQSARSTQRTTMTALQALVHVIPPPAASSAPQRQYLAAGVATRPDRGAEEGGSS